MTRSSRTYPGGTPLEFTRYAAERAAGFQGREWVFAEIDAWMASPGAPRYFLLTGEPGSGKTAIAGRLLQLTSGETEPVRERPRLSAGFLGAAHFCSARDSSWVDPRTFSRSIAAQLAATYEEFRFALMDLGDKDIHIDARMDVGTALGNSRLTTLEIRTLDLSGLHPQEAFNRSVLDPLEAIYAGGFDEPITILVDALDESLVHAGDVTIVGLLSRVEYLSPNVRFILTSRPDERVEHRLHAAHALSLSGTEFARRWSADMRRFVGWRVAQDKGLREKVGGLTAEHAAGFVTTVADCADANFLYAGFLLSEMASGLRPIDDLEHLPAGLDALYYESLNRVLTLGERTEWSEYAPLLGVLSVAMEGLTLDELRSVLGRPEREVWKLVGDLRQLIDEVAPRESTGETRYRLYHQSIVDFLRKRHIAAECRTLRNRYYLPSEEWHRHLRNHYRADAASWEAVDWARTSDYGLRHLAAHVSGTGGDRRDLYELICRPFMRHKLERYAALLPLAEDVALAIAAAGAERPPNLAEEARLSLVYGTMVSLASRMIPEALGLLAELGRVDEARGFAQLIPMPDKQSRAYLLIGEALVRRGEPGEAKLLLEKALAAGKRIELASTRSEVLGPVVAALARAGDATAPGRVVDLLDDETRKGMLEGLAEAATVAKDTDTSRRILAQARGLLNAAQRSLAFASIALGVAAAGDHDAAREIAEDALREADRVADEELEVRTLCNAVRAFARAGDKGRSAKIDERVMQSAFRTSSARYGPFLLPDVIRTFDACDDEGGLARALTLFEQLPAEQRMAWVVGVVARAAARLGSRETFDRAIELLRAAATEPGDSEEKARALGVWALALAAAGDSQGLKALMSPVRAIAANWYGYQALQDVAQALAEVREFDLALDVAREIPIEVRVFVQIEIARALAGAEEREKAISTVSRTLGSHDLRAQWSKAEALCSLAMACARVRRTAEASEIARTALRVTEPLANDLTYLSYTVGALVEVARALTEARDWEGLDLAVCVANRLHIEERARVLARIGLAVAENDEVERADRILELAETAIEMAHSSERRAIDLGDVARAFARIGRTEQAFSAARRAQKEANETDSESKRAEALSFVARAWADAGGWDEALALADQVLTVAHSWRLKWEEEALGLWTRATMLLNVAIALAAAGRVELAFNVIEEIQMPSAKATAIAEVGEILGQRNNQDSTARLLAAGRAIDAPFARVQVLVKLAGVIARLGEAQSAAAATCDSRVAAGEIENDDSKADALSRVAAALAAGGQLAEAVPTLRAAFAAARSSGVHAVYNALEHGASTLAAVDHGRTLWRIFEATRDVDNWLVFDA